MKSPVHPSFSSTPLPEDESFFAGRALEVFRFQAASNPVYCEFVRHLKINPEDVREPSDIPFLPLELFKQSRVVSGTLPVQRIFRSSGTTESIPAEHHVCDLALYEESILKGFRLSYGDPDQFVFLALLPSYLERNDASLVYMVDFLMRSSSGKPHGFFLNDLDNLHRIMQELITADRRFMLIGVTFALMDFVHRFPISIGSNVVVETGGMKGRRKELVREALHEQLVRGFGVEAIHSEYGMTELLSQAWSKGNGRYVAPPWMKVEIVDQYDPRELLPIGRTGLIRVTDLANVYSCAFLLTQDLGRRFPDGSFEVLGRSDQSDIRGCNLMVE